mmetsp:Transcript_70275/g.197018  ORF Transcript_70275/g.197018 Transcript_70275/m.197018 type:complete len:647 (-) Transcript_70275:1264-3204(-)
MAVLPAHCRTRTESTRSPGRWCTTDASLAVGNALAMCWPWTRSRDVRRLSTHVRLAPAEDSGRAVDASLAARRSRERARSHLAEVVDLDRLAAAREDRGLGPPGDLDGALRGAVRAAGSDERLRPALALRLPLDLRGEETHRLPVFRHRLDEVHHGLVLLRGLPHLGVLERDGLLVDDARGVVVEDELVEHLGDVDDEKGRDVEDPDRGRLLPIQRLLEDVHGQQRCDDVPQHRRDHQLRRGAAQEEEPWGARREDQELRGDRDLQPNCVLRVDAVGVAILLVRADALDETLVHAEVEDEGRQALHRPERHGEADEAGDARVLRLSRGRLAVLGDRDHGDVVEERQKDHIEGVESAIEGVDQHAQEDQDLDGGGQTVGDVREKAREDLPRLHDGAEDGAEALGREDHGGGVLRGVRGVVHRDAALRGRQGGGVVDAVAGHAHHEAVGPLEGQHALALVPGQHLREAAGLADDLVAGVGRLAGHLAREDVRRHADEAGRLLRDVEVVAGDHLHLHAGLHEALDRERGVEARRVDHGEEAEEVHRAALDARRDRDGLVPQRGELGVLLLDHLGELRVVAIRALPLEGAGVCPARRRVQDLRREALGHDDLLALAVHGGHCALDLGVEAREVELLVGRLALRELRAPLL